MKNVFIEDVKVFLCAGALQIDHSDILLTKQHPTLGTERALRLWWKVHSASDRLGPV